MENYVGKICPFCKTEIKEGEAVKVCPSCGIAHHEGCWEENHGCTTFGCSEQNSVQPKEEKAFCTKCGAELPIGTAFCVSCGAPVTGTSPNIPSQQNTYVPPANSAASAYPGPGYTPTVNKTKPRIDADYIANTIVKKSNSIVAFVGGLFSGLLSIVFGIVCFCLDTGRYVSYESYGGDAYTGIQHAAAGTGNNVQDLAAILKFGFGALLLVVGIAICCFFISKLIEVKSLSNKGE